MVLLFIVWSQEIFPAPSIKTSVFVVGFTENPCEPQTLITPFAEPLRPAPVEVVTICHGVVVISVLETPCGFLPAVACFPAASACAAACGLPCSVHFAVRSGSGYLLASARLFAFPVAVERVLTLVLDKVKKNLALMNVSRSGPSTGMSARFGFSDLRISLLIVF